MGVNYEAVISKFIKTPPATMYDIGVGPKSEYLTLGKIYPAMSIRGCEPNPELASHLVRNCFPGILVPVAIGEKEGTATLNYDPTDPKTGGFFRHYSTKVDVDVWTLDHFDQFNEYPKGILLWMDIEGMELAALRSGVQLLKSGRVRWINLEERRDDTPKKVKGWADPASTNAFLKRFGYVRVADYNRHKTHQDVIYRHRSEPRRR